MRIFTLVVVLSANAGGFAMPQDLGGAPVPRWVGLAVTCAVTTTAGAVREERISRASDGSQRGDTRRAASEGSDLQLRNRAQQRFYRKLPDGEWLVAPMPGHAAPPTLAAYQRPGSTITDAMFEGKRALKVTTTSGTQILVPDFDFFAVEQDDLRVKVRCKDLEAAAPPASDFAPPADTKMKEFPSMTELNAYATAKRGGD